MLYKSSPHLSKYLYFLIFLTIIITGINGLITYMLLTIFSRFELGRDPIIKHGLVSGTSRLGGLAITFSSIVGVCISLFLLSALSYQNIVGELDRIILFSLLIGLVGLAEDFHQNLNSKTRLCIIFFLSGISLIYLNDLLPFHLELFSNTMISSNYYIVFFITLFLLVGFINAGNIADGANGLLSSIYVIFFMVIYSINPTIFNFSMMMSLSVFFIYNVSTGRIFLGDFGSYSLSALVAFNCLEIYSKFSVSVFLFSSILIYPCFEILRSLLIRLLQRTPLLSPDNFHLHNRVYEKLVSLGCSQNLANSYTGVSLGLISAGPPLLIFYSGIDLNSYIWFYLFGLQLTFFILIDRYITKNYCLK